jgi:predicted phosphodiesterase
MPEVLAVLADIHGNSWALDAVLEDARTRGATGFADLGDSAWGPLDPRGTMDRLAELGAVSVRGNEDRFGTSPQERAMVDQLGAAYVEQLAARPTTAEIGAVLLCHGTPSDDAEYLLEEVTAAGARRRPPADVARRIDEGSHARVLCGHTHLPRVLPLPSGPLVANPGSVGCPAYEDDRPWPHVMESGSPQARYALVHDPGGTPTIEHRAVDYPWALAADAARANGRPDWAVALTTGLTASTVRGSART